MKTALAMTVFVSSLVMSGCYHTRVVKEPVYIPTKCEILRPIKPAHKDTEVENTRSVLVYTQELESALDFCLGVAK